MPETSDMAGKRVAFCRCSLSHLQRSMLRNHQIAHNCSITSYANLEFFIVYIYIHSSIANQNVEKWRWVNKLKRCLERAPFHQMIHQVIQEIQAWIINCGYSNHLLKTVSRWFSKWSIRIIAWSHVETCIKTWIDSSKVRNPLYKLISIIATMVID
jgi:hypothetical protein